MSSTEYAKDGCPGDVHTINAGPCVSSKADQVTVSAIAGYITTPDELFAAS